ncbi:VWA domain-containing protein [Alkalinema sp. FACHB-956]|uniref:vWA domain-containing protein n=1 Tax=Alkalinema sp. FACHB-956 TaxID=2692768 RepID=UPI0016894FC3|nr:VWA domain-containing protein [Alkalinema sp. FACHB-956]MBD2325630.1 VWA domain-containing protein [Alkalinema sp. FACHB-956]
MKVGLEIALSDVQLDVTQANSQRQAAISVFAMPEPSSREVPLNLCLILDHSGSMRGKSLDTVKQAAKGLIEKLTPGDRITIIAFNHEAHVLVANQTVNQPADIQSQLDALTATGGTNIDEGLKLGIEECAKGKQGTVSQIFLLTDGENEHGNNDRCLKLAHVATGYGLTINALGFGDNWNQDILEQIADAGIGALAYIAAPELAVTEFDRLLNRAQSVGLTNAHLMLKLAPNTRLAELKPLAQVAPETIELPVTMEGDIAIARLGDLLVDAPRVVLANLYFDQLPEGSHTVAQVQVRYDNPLTGTTTASDISPITLQAVPTYTPQPNPAVQTHILALAKYRQTQIAENKLQQGDKTGAATMLQTAANTALQMGDRAGATVLQETATRLQSGETLSERDRKQTRIASKTVLQG